jgi:hypothetical protein
METILSYDTETMNLPFGKNLVAITMTVFSGIYSKYGMQMPKSIQGGHKSQGATRSFRLDCNCQVPMTLFFTEYLRFLIGKDRTRRCQL